VLELADGVDLLIHDAQYTDDDWDKKSHWGHCTVDYAVFVAKEAGAKSLALFHHDPAHGDDKLDKLLEYARGVGDKIGAGEVLSAYEGLTVSYER
jgi:ribonuclease BN (tRNA processing enzyme)